MSRTTRLFICLIALLTLFTLLWPGRAEASRLAACLTTITVTSANDSGPGSLRQALADVCSGGTVDFAAGLANQTIILTSTELSITKTVTITNPNAANLQVSGNNERRVFNIQAGAVVTMSHFNIISGTATDGCDPYYCGGGIRISSEATLVLNNSILSENIATFGAGIMNSGILTISNSILRNNGANSVEGVSVYGGGIENGNNATLTVNNSTFDSNLAGEGGGIINYGIAMVNNSTFSNNNASFYGGGIYNTFYNTSLTVNNSTFSGNSSAYSYGGGIATDGTLYLRNSLIADSPKGGDCYNSGTITANLNNLIEDGSCNPALSGDPLLGPLADNGGVTLTHGLLPGSPAINAGNNASCLTTDQRGIARPQQGQCDIGAFESRGFTLTRNTGNNQTAPIGNSFNTPLGVMVTSSASEPVSGGVITFTGPGSGASTNPISTTAIVSGSTASTNVTANAVAGGPYNVTASVGGGNSVNFSLTNTKVTPTVVVTSSANPTVVGQVVTFTATISFSIGTPTGSATFIVDGTPQSPVSLLSGKATFSTSSLTVGNHTLSVNYSGDANFNVGSGSLVDGQTVNKANSTTGVTSLLNPSTLGQMVTFTVTVTAASLDSGIPTGNVTFVIDGTPQSPVTLAGGQTTFSTSSLAVGNHTVSANYNGNASFNASSGSLAGGQRVNALDAPTVQFTQATYTISEGMGTSQNLILTRSGNLADVSQVQVSLSGGTATAGTDYSSAGFPKTITFGRGVVSQTVPIAISGDTQVEPTETISLTLSPLSNAVIGAQSSAVLQIEDNGTVCLTNVTVINTNDSGAGSLRQVLADACSGGTVVFAAGLANQTITLTSAELSITKTVTITNPNAANLQVSGNNERRVFNIQAGAVVTMSNLSVISGTAYNDIGGGIYNSGSITIANSIINNNSADSGGGIFSNGGMLTIINSTFTGNSANFGGGIFNAGPLSISNSTFSGNSASSVGGGIANAVGGRLVINDSTLSDNSANEGGAIFVNGGLTLNNSTLTGNSATYGGGIINYGGVTVNNSTLSGNSASNIGGGIYNYMTTLNLQNSIIANSPNGGDCYIAYGPISTDFNSLIEDGSCNPTISGDPNLGPLQNNGGSTLTHALLPGSKAIDAGDATTCLSTDQRGVVRPLDGNSDGVATCDIGAVEASGSPAPTIQFTQATYITNENAGTSQKIILTRTGILSGSSQVQVSFSGGTATAGADYSSTGFPNTITFGSGVVSQTVSIAIINDTQVEPTETISLTLSPLGNAVIGAPSSAVLQIEDNDTAALPPKKVYLPTVIK